MIPCLVLIDGICLKVVQNCGFSGVEIEDVSVSLCNENVSALSRSKSSKSQIDKTHPPQ